MPLNILITSQILVADKKNQFCCSIEKHWNNTSTNHISFVRETILSQEVEWSELEVLQKSCRLRSRGHWRKTQLRRVQRDVTIKVQHTFENLKYYPIVNCLNFTAYIFWWIKWLLKKKKIYILKINHMKGVFTRGFKRKWEYFYGVSYYLIYCVFIGW